MKNLLIVDGEKAVVSFDPEIEMFRGEFVGLNGGADFYATTVAGLVEERRRSLAVFIELCREQGIDPHKHFSGKFDVRLDPKDHEAATIAAAAAGKSLNDWIIGTIKEAAAA